jgi:hypothetical protein
MLNADILTLTPVRLQGRQRWHHETADLTFVFPGAGTAQCVWREGAQHLKPGDILLLNSDPRSELGCQTRGKFGFS